MKLASCTGPIGRCSEGMQQPRLQEGSGEGRLRKLDLEPGGRTTKHWAGQWVGCQLEWAAPTGCVMCSTGNQTINLVDQVGGFGKCLQDRRCSSGALWGHSALSWPCWVSFSGYHKDFQSPPHVGYGASGIVCWLGWLRNWSDHNPQVSLVVWGSREGWGLMTNKS